jgi:hypothetical protein
VGGARDCHGQGGSRQRANRRRAATGWNNESMKLEHSGPEGAPVQIKPTTVIDVQFLTHEQRAQFRSVLLTAKALGEKDRPDECQTGVGCYEPRGTWLPAIGRSPQRAPQKSAYLASPAPKSSGDDQRQSRAAFGLGWSGLSQLWIWARIVQIYKCRANHGRSVGDK